MIDYQRLITYSETVNVQAVSMDWLGEEEAKREVKIVYNTLIRIFLSDVQGHLNIKRYKPVFITMFEENRQQYTYIAFGEEYARNSCAMGPVYGIVSTTTGVFLV